MEQSEISKQEITRWFKSDTKECKETLQQMDDWPQFKFNTDNMRDSGFKSVFSQKGQLMQSAAIQEAATVQIFSPPAVHQPYCIYIPTLQLLPQPSNILLWRYMQPSQTDATNKPVVCVRTKRLPTPGTAAAKLQLTPLQEHWENAGAARAYQMNPPSGSC